MLIEKKTAKYRMRKIYDSKIIYTFFNTVFLLYDDNVKKRSWQKVNSMYSYENSRTFMISWYHDNIMTSKWHEYFCTSKRMTWMSHMIYMIYSFVDFIRKVDLSDKNVFICMYSCYLKKDISISFIKIIYYI